MNNVKDNPFTTAWRNSLLWSNLPKDEKLRYKFILYDITHAKESSYEKNPQYFFVYVAKMVHNPLPSLEISKDEVFDLHLSKVSWQIAFDSYLKKDQLTKPIDNNKLYNCELTISKKNQKTMTIHHMRIYDSSEDDIFV